MDELELVVEDISTVPEQYRGLYVEKDGKHALNVTVKGMKPEAEFNTVMGALRKERTDHSATKQKLNPFLQLGNPEEVSAQLARIPELEIAAEGKIDDKKIEKLVETRLNGKLAPVQRELTETKTKLNEAQTVIDGFKTKEKTRTIHDAVRGAATKSKGFRSEAMEDALMLAERVLDLDESGSVVTKDGVGVTPGVDPSVWFTELQIKRPHWWGESVGGGAGGSGSGSGVGLNPFTYENWNLTEQGRIHNENPVRADQLAKAAGTTVGGGKPAPKKK